MVGSDNNLDGFQVLEHPPYYDDDMLLQQSHKISVKPWSVKTTPM